MGAVAYTVEQALEQMRHFCAYQERCHGEVRARLARSPLVPEEVEEVVSRLIGEDFLNEERFAVALAGGKFRMLQWGRVRIRHELKRRGVSDANIRKGLSAIDEDDYLRVMERLAEQRWVSSVGRKGDLFDRRRRLAAYLLQKGFESDRVRALVDRMELH
jgi:regulatory protein